MTAGRHTAFRPALATMAGFLLLPLLLPTLSLAAQDAASAHTVRGLVTDEVLGSPIEGILVELEEDGRLTLTDAQGRFIFEDVNPSFTVVIVDGLGYVTLQVRIAADAPGVHEFRLMPKPAVLEGITVQIDRLQRRRRRTPYAMRVVDQAALARRSGLSVVDLLRHELATSFFPCGLGDRCVRIRGRMIPILIYIDEFEAFGGLDELYGYQPQDLYEVEIIRRCATVRIYTKHFMESLVEHPRSLFPTTCGIRAGRPLG